MKIEEGRWDTQFIEKLLKANRAKFGLITDNAERFRFQVLVSEVAHDQQPRFVRYAYRVDNEYFYPASAIKLCAAVAVPGKLRALQNNLGLKVTCTTPLLFYPISEGDNVQETHSANSTIEMTTIAHEIRKLFLVSDNIAFNRLYALVGQGALNQTMWSLGLQSTRIFHRLSVELSIEQNKICGPIELDLNGIPVTLPPKKSKLAIPDTAALHGVHVGNAYIAQNGKLIEEPMDFSKKNCMSLLDLQNLLVKLFQNDIELGRKPIEIDEDFKTMLKEAMCQYPKDSCNPNYLESEYPDDYSKFFLPGLSRVCHKGSLRIYNKGGRAYGFSIDNAYVFDIESGRSFFLSAVIYTNANGILNDDIYEYEEVADRVMADLAEVVARALWQIPGNSFVASHYDCMPSSLWKTWNLPWASINYSFESAKTSQSQYREGLTQQKDEVIDKVGDDNDASELYCHPNNPHWMRVFDGRNIDTDTSVEVGFSSNLLNQKTFDRNCSISAGTCLDTKHIYFINE